MLRHWRIILLGVIVSGAAILLIITQIDLQALLEALRNANYLPLIPAALLAAGGLYMRAIRWRVLLRGGLPIWRSFHIINIAYLINGLLPARIGEVARAWLASRGEPSVPIFRSAGTIVVERLLDLLMVVIFIAIALAAGPVPDELRAAGTFFGVAAVAGFVVLVIFAAQRQTAQRLLAFVMRVLPFLNRLNLSEWLDHLLDGFELLTRPRAFANAVLWTVISWGFSFASGYVTMFAFYPEADVTATLLFIAAASFAVAFPAVPGNVGPYEASILLALGALGYWTAGDTTAFAVATAFALSVHFVNLLVNAILGVIGFVAEGVTLEQVSRGVRQTQYLDQQQLHQQQDEVK